MNLFKAKHFRFILMIVMFLTDNCSSHMNKTHINYEQIKINEKDLFKLIAKFANKHNMTVSIKLEKNVEAGLGLRMGNTNDASEIKVFPNESARSEDKNEIFLQNNDNDWVVDQEIFEAIFPGFTFDDETENGITIEVPIGVAGDGVYHIVNKIAFLCLPLFILLIHYHHLF